MGTIGARRKKPQRTRAIGSDEALGQLLQCKVRVVILNFLTHTTKTVESEEISKEWSKFIEDIEDLESKEVLFLLLRHSLQNGEHCGSGGVVHVRRG